MFKVNHEELKSLIREYYKEKLSLFVFGAFGIGKSFIVKEVGKELAKERGREFREWNKISKEEKDEVFNNPNKYFVLIDERLSEKEPSDLMGLPSFMEDSEVLNWKLPYWAKFVSKKDSDGIIFFDEINLACLKGGSKVLTLGGYKDIKDIQKGDMVLNGLGTFSPVRAKQDTLYRGDIYTIKAQNMQKVEATPQHPFYVMEKYRKENKKWNIKPFFSKPLWKKAKDLKKGDYLAIPILQEVREYKISPKIAKLMGYYTAEGSIGEGSKNYSRINISLNKKEREIVEDIREIIKTEFKRELRENVRRGKNGIDVRFGTNNSQRKFFEDCGRSCYTKRIPEYILYNRDLDVLKNFLEGYFLGDGSFVRGDITSFITMTTTSEELAFQLQTAYARFGVCASVNLDTKVREYNIGGRKGLTCGRTYIIRTPNKRIHRLFELPYSRNRATEHFVEYDNKLWVRIRSVKKTKEQTMVYNFEVEDTQTYTSNNILTHNCPLVVSSVYKIIYDRIIGEENVNSNWLIMGAGNRDCDHAFTHSLPAPVRDRGGECELIIGNKDNWTNWAMKNKIDNRIIAYINFQESSLYNVDFNNNQKYTTSRGWERVSRLIKDRKVDNSFELLVCSAIGEGIAREFIGYCKIMDKLKIDDVVKDPNKIKEIKDLGTKYMLITSLAERFASDEKYDFKELMKLTKALDEADSSEFIALLWKMSSTLTIPNSDGLTPLGNKEFANRFSLGYTESREPEIVEILDKYGRYLVNF